MYTDLVTVIVPAYNAEYTINKCINSIQTQTYTNLEILIVDDGSNDNTLNILRLLQKTDTRIQVIHQENGGPSRARNVGLDMAKGEFILFVDADDWIESNCIQQAVLAIKKEHADIVLWNAVLDNDLRESWTSVLHTPLTKSLSYNEIQKCSL